MPDAPALTLRYSWAMLRMLCLAVLLAALLAGIAPGADRDQDFLSSLATQPSDRLQAELGISAEDADSLLAVAREYQAQAQALEQAMKRAVFDRRLARMTGEGEGAATEAQLVEARERLSNQITRGQMQDLKARLGETKYRRVQDYIEARKEDEAFFPSPMAKGKAVLRR